MNSICYCLFVCLIFALSVHGQIHKPATIPRDSFDQELYKSVIDLDRCRLEIAYMKLANLQMFLRFLDLSFRVPVGLVDNANVDDYGDYFKCLELESEPFQYQTIKGKYCSIRVPLVQNIELPSLDDLINGTDIINSSQTKRKRDLDHVFKASNVKESYPDIIAKDLNSSNFRLGICMPRVCPTKEWIEQAYFNVSLIGLKYEEEYCRLPNDKPWVAADTIAIIVFTFLGVATVLSTCYDLYWTLALKKNPKEMDPVYSSFSVYTNTRRLTTVTYNKNALHCLDGIRVISMMWVIFGHTFSMYNTFANLLDVVDFLLSAPATFVHSGIFAVDTFLTMAGALLVYSTVGKTTPLLLLKTLHNFYLNRLLRLFPLLAAIILLEASVFHRIADGPYWLTMARNVERCRNWWWTTLLYVQNYVNPNDICVQHSWYLAIDMQLHIVSPLILVWVYSGKRKLAWSVLLGVSLIALAGCTVYNFLMNLPSSNSNISRINEQQDYMKLYYQNTLTRCAPFFFGMALGYLLSITKGKTIKINNKVVLAAWVIALAMVSTVFYITHEIMQLSWKNQLGDNIYNSFARPVWSLALCWIIFACARGHGGVINWFLSLNMWVIPARISYAMYLFHYSFLFIAAGRQVRPVYFSVGSSLFDYIGHLFLTTVTAFVVTVLIDAPFSTLTKILLSGGSKKPRKPAPVKKNDREENNCTNI